jgi:ribonuclease J
LCPTGFLHDREPFVLGPYHITPYLVDHSAFDAYALLIEEHGRRLFYTGDYRAHGRKSGLFSRLLREHPRGVDVLLTEGTLLDPNGEATRVSRDEAVVEQECIRVFKATPGMALVVYSAQNIDRLVTLYRAAVQTDRDFVMDLYAAAIARAADQKGIPCPGPEWPRVKVFVPLRQRLAVRDAAEFERVQWVKQSRIYPEALSGQRNKIVMTFRPSMAKDLEDADCLEGASLVWSLWHGYLERDERLHGFRTRYSLPLVQAHCSGHACPQDIKCLIRSMAPQRVVPIHTSAPEGFLRLSNHVELQSDAEWWSV